MSSTADTHAEFSTWRDDLTRHLDWFAERGLFVPVWWRDDDAVEPSPALERLLAIANAHGVEVALAVIPKDATPALADRLAGERFACVLQHGYEHRNFQDKARGEKAAELGRRRDPDEALALVANGRERLAGLFGTRFVPVMVPPWNRIAPRISSRLGEAGLVGLSTFTQFHPRALPHVQTHIDMIKWKKERRFIGWQSARLRFDFHLARRRNNPDEPLGILSHHLAQDEASFDFLDRTFGLLAAHPGARFARIADLLPPSRPVQAG
ncbi:polysaccharide deacetylase family protein [Stappia sp. MMSF_3263]|uniref:polysaccharide deacetylase family protein n=1 Tax=Stappia sp. MMSF_3263 TaxID=3046693 RepID=UPI00273DDF2B|nr:polysaccharide deacetylase family protein [Stappia sp. MMSF_3263]